MKVGHRFVRQAEPQHWNGPTTAGRREAGPTRAARADEVTQRWTCPKTVDLATPPAVDGPGLRIGTSTLIIGDRRQIEGLRQVVAEEGGRAQQGDVSPNHAPGPGILRRILILEVVERDHLRQSIVLLVIEEDRDLVAPTARSLRRDGSAGSLGDTDRLVGSLMTLSVTDTGRADQPVELNRLSKAIDRDGNDVSRGPGTLETREECARLVAGEVDEPVLDPATRDKSKAQGHSIAWVGIGQGQQGVDPAGTIGFAGVLRKEEKTAGFDIADSTPRRRRSHLRNASPDDWLIDLLESECVPGGMCECPAGEGDRHCQCKLADPGSASLLNGHPSLIEALHVPSSSIGHQWESFGGSFHYQIAG